MPHPIQLVIFDLDGTLIDSRLDVTDAINHALVKLGHAALPRETLYRFMGDGIQRSIERILGAQASDLLEQAIQIYRSHYSRHLLDHTVLYPHVEETLAAFGHKKKAVVSNKRQEPSVAILEGLRVSHHFDMILGGDQVQEKKPAPEAILRTLNQLEVAPKQAIMIGDSPEDTQAGRTAGLITCGVTYGFHPKERLLAARPDYLIDSLQQLQGIIE
jgi:phosphoglycolate phosphatase